jgi:hypothetical protein
MTVKWSTTVRNAVLDAWESAMGTAIVIRVFTGGPPATVGTASSGTLLVEYTLASDWAANAASGAKTLNSLPIAGAAVATGTAGYYRIFASGGVTCHEQGTVTATGGGGDMTISNVSLTNLQVVNITSFTLTAPRA